MIDQRSPLQWWRCSCCRVRFLCFALGCHLRARLNPKNRARHKRVRPQGSASQCEIESVKIRGIERTRDAHQDWSPSEGQHHEIEPATGSQMPNGITIDTWPWHKQRPWAAMRLQHRISISMPSTFSEL